MGSLGGVGEPDIEEKTDPLVLEHIRLLNEDLDRVENVGSRLVLA